MSSCNRYSPRRPRSAPLFGLIAAALSLAIMVACGSTGKRAAAFDKSDSPGIAAADPSKSPPHVSPASEKTDAESDPTADSALEEPGDLIDRARAHCTEGNYAAADSSLKKAISAIVAIDAQSDSGGEEWFPSSSLLDEIVAIYKEKMPGTFSLPEDIAMTEFQREMVRSLDSIKLMPPESLSIAAMKCMQDGSYDVPIIWNERVQRAVNFYIKHRQTTIDLWFDRSRYYLPLMRTMFAASGLPQDLAYLPFIESGFNPHAYSFAHASGIWQFIASTGKRFGLRRSFWLDERRDPIRSTEAAIAYLKKLYGDFGDWHLALAAYNCGENGVARHIARHKTNDYWRLRRLPAETRSYVPFYLAAVTIAKNSHCFGIVSREVTPFPLDTVLVNDCISLEDIAAGIGIATDTLKKLNPHILRWCTPPDTSNILLYLPAGAKKAWITFRAQLPAEKLVRWTRYLIKRGDNSAALERYFNLATGMIKSINRLTGDRLVSGRHLFIPVTDAPLSDPLALSLPPENEIKNLDIHDYEFSGTAVRHRIRKGDNLSQIAQRYHTTVRQLCRWNRISRKTLLRPGRTLIVSKPRQPKQETISAPVAALPEKAPATDTPAAVQNTRIVQKGDTPYSIAREAGITLNDLIAWNTLDSVLPRIHPGDTLLIALPDTSPAVTSDTGLSLASAFDTPETKTPESGGAAAIDGSSQSDGDTARSEKVQDGYPGGQPDTSLYTILPGENLFRIALKFSVPLQSLLDFNNLKKNSVIHAGDMLRIPSRADTGHAAVGEKAVPPDVLYYRIKQGDTMARIAEAFGITVEEIYKNNNLKPTAFLTPGKTIIIKAGG